MTCAGLWEGWYGSRYKYCSFCPDGLRTRGLRQGEPSGDCSNVAEKRGTVAAPTRVLTERGEECACPECILGWSWDGFAVCERGNSLKDGSWYFSLNSQKVEVSTIGAGKSRGRRFFFFLKEESVEFWPCWVWDVFGQSSRDVSVWKWVWTYNATVLSIEVMNEITKRVSIKRKEETSVFILLFLYLLCPLSCWALSLFLYIEKFLNIC